MSITFASKDELKAWLVNDRGVDDAVAEAAADVPSVHFQRSTQVLSITSDQLERNGLPILLAGELSNKLMDTSNFFDSAVRKLSSAAPPYPLAVLPTVNKDELWGEIRTTYKLSLPELTALQHYLRKQKQEASPTWFKVSGSISQPVASQAGRVRYELYKFAFAHGGLYPPNELGDESSGGGNDRSTCLKVVEQAEHRSILSFVVVFRDAADADICHPAVTTGERIPHLQGGWCRMLQDSSRVGPAGQ